VVEDEANGAQAYEACLTAADEEGLVTYYESLMSLRVIRALHAEPERGQRLLGVRRLIARAQDSADAGRYQDGVRIYTANLKAINESDPKLSPTR
jgi:hypothetical protein